MQLSLFVDAKRVASADLAVLHRQRPSKPPTLATVIARSQAAHTADTHAVAVDACASTPKFSHLMNRQIPAPAGVRSCVRRGAVGAPEWG